MVLAANTFHLIVIPLAIIWVCGIIDIIRRRIRGSATIGWLLVVILLPVLGTILYFTLRKPTEEDIAAAKMAAGMGYTDPGAGEHAGSREGRTTDPT